MGKVKVNQIWYQGEDKLRDQYKPWVEEYKKITDGNHAIHSEQTIRKLIKEHCPEYLHTFDSYDYWVMRVDFGKYVLMFLAEGPEVAIDMDTVPTGKSFDDLIKLADNHVLWESVTDQNEMALWPKMDFVNNHFMFTPCKRHPFWKYLLDQAVIQSKRQLHHVKPYYILNSIGPFFVMRCIEEWNSRLVDTVKLLPSPPFREYFSHESHISWLRKDSFDVNDAAALLWIAGAGYLGYRLLKGK